jgi:biopolymer transport protein ExbD
MRLDTRKEAPGEEVPITPLIDCVFLLIIFFLVTSMFKRFEMLIPIELPDSTSSLAEEAREKSVRLAINQSGAVLESSLESLDQDIQAQYTPIGDFSSYLQQLGTEKGAATPLQFSVDREAPTQKVIDILDIAQLQGFTNVTVRTLPVQ